MKQLKPQEILAAELERLIAEVQAALSEYRAATAKTYRRRPVMIRDPRNGKTIKTKRGNHEQKTSNNQM